MLEAPLVVLLVSAALLFGVAIGLCMASTSTPAPRPAPQAPDPPKPPMGAFADRLRPVARALLVRGALEPREGEVEQLAEHLGALAAEAWAEGVSDFREALVAGSVLPPELVGQLCDEAVAELEGPPG